VALPLPGGGKIFIPSLSYKYLVPPGRKVFMPTPDISKTADAWAPLSRTLFVPHTENE